MKNPHGVDPTQFMKRKESEYAIKCEPEHGPVFGSDIEIYDNCNVRNRCSISNDGTNEYECHSEYKSSFYVNTSGSAERNSYSVLDYEVFGIDYENRNNIYKLCKHPDIVWEYIQTKDISDDTLKQIDSEEEIRKDFDLIQCNDHDIRLKISKCSLRNESKLLYNTTIVGQQYDSVLREWLGSDYKWKLIYRASEHGYTAKSFHECCDDKGPTLVVIKSIGGWIFGGYTTQSWSGDSIGKRDDKAFIFTLKNPYGVEPTRYIQREDSRCAIGCVPNEGPLFGHVINIHNNCNEEKSCAIDNHLLREYECHPEYEHSLYVNTAEPFSKNPFTVLDYEVFEQN